MYRRPLTELVPIPSCQHRKKPVRINWGPLQNVSLVAYRGFPQKVRPIAVWYCRMVCILLCITELY